jgi:hypothetical protein
MIHVLIEVNKKMKTISFGVTLVSIIFLATMCTKPGDKIEKKVEAKPPVSLPSTPNVITPTPTPTPTQSLIPKSAPTTLKTEYTWKDGTTHAIPEISTKLNFGKPMKVDIKSWPDGTKRKISPIVSPKDLILNPVPIPIPDSGGLRKQGTNK